MMEFQTLSSGSTRQLSSSSKIVREIKAPLSRMFGVPQRCIEIVNKEAGIIYEDSYNTESLPHPLEVMVGKNERRVPLSLRTWDLDMVDGKLSADDPRLKMSCGHAITPDNLFHHMRHSLMNKKQAKITCLASGCNKEWDMDEIIQKADMTNDEALFYEYQISLNALFQDSTHTSQCPQCGNFCQRQGNNKIVRCTLCTSKNKTCFDFCWDCYSPYTSNHRCENKDKEAVQKILNEAPRKPMKYSPENIVPSIRLCPKCNILIEHIDLCKQIKCWKCNTDFCFCCLTLCENGSLQCSGYNKKCNVASVQTA